MLGFDDKRGYRGKCIANEVTSSLKRSRAQLRMMSLRGFVERVNRLHAFPTAV
jgi:hypothetical protein